MIPVLAAAALRDVDRLTIAEENISSTDLMERAAGACTAAMVKLLGPNQPAEVIVVVGPGNNGGDGLVIARRLAAAGHSVVVGELGFGRPTADYLTNRARLPTTNLRCLGHAELLAYRPQPADLVIDAIFGSGLSRPPAGPAAAAIRWINKQSAPVWSVDLPSGLYPDRPPEDIFVRADRTFNLGYPKPAQFASESGTAYGKITTVNFPLADPSPSAAPYPQLITARDAASFLRQRGPYDHKGTFGHALVVAGARGTMGAALLCARAALRAGAGLITSHVPAVGYEIMQNGLPEGMCLTDPAQNHLTNFPEADDYAAVGIGPGIGQEPATVAGLLEFLTTTDRPLVVDADALNVLAKHPAALSSLPPDTILTPHPKEFSRLFGKQISTFAAWRTQAEQARKLGVVIVLKGGHTTVADPQGQFTFNDTGNPGMGTGGSGDVLTGILTGLLAQGYPPARAARLGVHLHGLAGDLAAAASSQESLIAGDLIDQLGAAFRTLRTQQRT